MTFEELLERDGHLAYTNKGTSMMPLLREGKDIMIIEKKEQFHKLDAVLFKRPNVSGRGAYVLHRILRIYPKDESGNRFYWIVGDNCVSGEMVEHKQILGVLTAVIRDGKKIDMASFRNQLYVNTWCRWYKLRFLLLRVKHKARAIKKSKP